MGEKRKFCEYRRTTKTNSSTERRNMKTLRFNCNRKNTCEFADEQLLNFYIRIKWAHTNGERTTNLDHSFDFSVATQHIFEQQKEQIFAIEDNK